MGIAVFDGVSNGAAATGRVCLLEDVEKIFAGLVTELLFEPSVDGRDSKVPAQNRNIAGNLVKKLLISLLGRFQILLEILDFSDAC
jgi:hypothetical protein